MSGRFLLDTNIVIAIFNGDQPVIDSLNQDNEIFIPSIVIGELLFGAQNSRNREANLKRIDTLVKTNVILGCDQGTAHWYGSLKHQLKKEGRPIPENDIWIAAIAFQYNLILVTRDNHFNQIRTLQTDLW